MSNKQYLDCLVCKDYSENCKPISGRRCSLFSVRDGWWQCDKCGGVWPNPHFDNPDIQAEFDAVTTCVHCVSLEMAKKRISELEAAAQWHDASKPPMPETEREVR